MSRLGPSSRPSSGNRDYTEQPSYTHQRSGSGRSTERGRGSRGHGSPFGTRPSGYSKEDRDGDLSMGGGLGDVSLAQSGGSVEVMITGWKGASDEDSVIQFIKRKADKPVQLSNIRYDGDKMIVTVSHFGQANSLTKLSGIRFAGDKMIFKILSSNSPSAHHGGPSSAHHGTPSSAHHGNGMDQSKGSGGHVGVIQVLQQVLQSRYNAQAKYLNMDAFDKDPLLVQHRIDGLSSYSGHAPSKIGAVICKLIGDMFPEVESISFANNNLKSLMTLETLPQRVPNLINLSFQNNNIQSYRDVDCMNGKDFVRLRELLFKGNPIAESNIGSSGPVRVGGELRYRNDIKKIFPTIQILDQQPFVDDIKFDIELPSANAPVQLPLAIGKSFYDSQITLGTANDFVQKYFQMFDMQRTALVDLYDPVCSTFSVSINANIVGHSRRREDFGAWWNMNRNLSKLGSTDKRVQLIKHGATEIVSALSAFPNTTHELTGNTFVVDAFQLPVPLVAPSANGTIATQIILMINVHGVFSETEPNGYRHKRSFDRTFTIVPAVPGSRSSLAGFGYTILNDELVLRGYHSKPGWTNTEKPLNAQETTQLQSLKTEQTLTDQQTNHIVNLMQTSNLNVGYAFQCLVQSGWDMNLAFQNFVNAKGQLGNDAYRC